MNINQIKKDLRTIYRDWNNNKLNITQFEGKKYSDMQTLVDAGHRLYLSEMQSNLKRATRKKTWLSLNQNIAKNKRVELNISFQEITKEKASKLWNTREVYGIDYEGFDSLISESRDLERFDMFGIENQLK